MPGKSYRPPSHVHVHIVNMHGGLTLSPMHVGNPYHRKERVWYLSSCRRRECGNSSLLHRGRECGISPPGLTQITLYQMATPLEVEVEVEVGVEVEVCTGVEVCIES